MEPDTQNTRFTKERYNTISNIYNLMEWPFEKLWYREWRKQLWSRIRGPEVLEIGVGTGKNIPYYPEGVNITAIDLSPGMLRHAKKDLAGRPGTDATLLEMDAQELEFDGESFDDVVATFAFCSIPDPVLALKEALRVTRPGGRLHLLEHMRSRNRVLAAVMKGADAPIHYLTGVHIARQTVRNVKAAGWQTDRVQNLLSGGIFRMIEASRPFEA